MAFQDYSLTPASNTLLADGTYIGPNMLRNKVRPALQQIAADGKALSVTVDQHTTQLAVPLTVTSASGQSVATVSLLAAIAAPVANQSATLTQSGREGLFVFSTSNLSAQVTLDPLQGRYVAPTAAPTGVSGAWVRKDDGIFRPEHYGAVADGVTDCLAAFNGMIAAMPNYGGRIEISRGFYRLSARITCGKSVAITGAGSGTRSYMFGETTSPNGWDSYTGTVLLYDNDAPGFLFPLHTDVEDTATVLANMGATGSNATYWEFPGADGISVSDVTLYSKGGTSTTAHGIESRARTHLRNVKVKGFGGDGFKVTASVDAALAGSAYGNASASTLTSCQAFENRGDGFRIIGRDANVIKIDSCEAVLNGGWGFYDEGFLGNLYINCHAAINNTLAASYPARGASANVNVGSFKSVNTNAPTVYVECYVEGGNGGYYDLTDACVVIGGIMSGTANGGVGIPYVQRGGILKQAPLTHINTNPGLAYDVAVDFGGTTTGRAYSFGTNDSGEDLNAGDRTGHMVYYPTPKAWSWEPPNISSHMWMNWPTFRTNVRKTAPAFPNGLYLGALDATMAAVGPHIGFTSAGAPPNGTYAVGDQVHKTAPTAGGKIGWVCTTAGTKAANWVSGTVYAPNVNPQSASYVTNAGNVYRNTTAGGGTSTNGPVHGAGTVTEADGYAWLWLNSTAAPVFKEWGAIDA